MFLPHIILHHIIWTITFSFQALKTHTAHPLKGPSAQKKEKKRKKSLISISCPQTENMQSLYCPHWGCTHTQTHRQDTMSSSVWPIPVVLLAKFNQALLSLSPGLAWWRQTRPSGLLLSEKITTTFPSLHPLTWGHFKPNHWWTHVSKMYLFCETRFAVL